MLASEITRGQFSSAVVIYPPFTAALSELGVQYLKLGQMDKAAETFESLLKLKPNDALAHLDLGIALYNQSTSLLAEKQLDESSQKLAQAESHLREALKLTNRRDGSSGVQIQQMSHFLFLGL
jgi:lipoprotein NlpI